MRPLTLEKPKPLIEVAGKSFLERDFDLFPDEVTEVIIVVGYKGEMIWQKFGDEFAGRKITYVVQPRKIGNADAVRRCLPYLAPGERFLLIYADDLHDKESVARLSKRPLGVLVYEVEDARKFGVMVVDGEDRITDMEEKPENPRSNLAATGVYLLDRELIEFLPKQHSLGEFFVTDQIAEAIKTRAVYVERESFWHAIGYPQDVIDAEEVLRKRNEK